MISKQVKPNAIVVLVVALCASPGPASADPARPASLEPSVTIHFADLNFASPEGVRVAYGRIASAAQKVCGTSFSIYDPNRWTSWRKCYRATIEAVVSRIDRPTLTAFHRAIARPPLGLRAETAGNTSR